MYLVKVTLSQPYFIHQGLGLVIAVKTLPLNYIALLVGCTALVSKTALFKVTLAILPPIIMKKMNIQLQDLKSRLVKKKPIRNKNDITIASITVYENQRWWAGLGWIEHLLKTERTQWTGFILFIFYRS